MNYHQISNSGKINDQSFQLSQKTLFLRQKLFKQYGSCKVPEKTNESIPRKLPEERREGRTLSHRTLPVTAGCRKRNCVCSLTKVAHHLLTHFLVGTPIPKPLLSPESFQNLWLLDYSSN